MSNDERKPWMVPVIYNDDRWAEPATRSEAPATDPGYVADDEDGDEMTKADVDRLIKRTGGQSAPNVSTDSTPLDYGKGPHDEEFGVDEDAPTSDVAPLPYENGPHDEEFGVDDDEDFEPSEEDEQFTDDWCDEDS